MVTENFKTYESFIEELIAFCTKRVAYKQKKLNEVKSWVNSKGCLHQNLYSFLEENVESLAENCCSHCGIDLPEENDSTTLKRNGELGATWQNILAERLLIEEINNEKKPS